MYNKPIAKALILIISLYMHELDVTFINLENIIKIIILLLFIMMVLAVRKL